jgi:flagellar biogenesis protein FliO
MPPHGPFEGARGHHELESSLAMLPVLGSMLLLLLLVLAALYLWRQEAQLILGR